MRDEPFCFWHAPATADEAAEARRLGGLHRRKKRVVAAAFDFRGLRTVEDSQALLETATVETMALENSVARNRALAGFATEGAKLVQLSDVEARLVAVEAAIRDARQTTGEPTGGLLGGSR